MNSRTRLISLTLAAAALGAGMPGESSARRGYGCCPSVESIRRNVIKRRKDKAAKAARKRNR